MKRASASEHNYFHRVATQNRTLPVDDPPNSLAEMFERLALLRLHTGQLAEAGLADLLISGTEYQKQAIQRSITETIDNVSVNILTAEDVIVHKLIAGRFQDLADIEAIVASMGNLDHKYIEEWVKFWEVGDLWNQVKAKTV